MQRPSADNVRSFDYNLVSCRLNAFSVLSLIAHVTGSFDATGRRVSPLVGLAGQRYVPLQPTIDGLAHKVALRVPRLYAGGKDGVRAAFGPFNFGEDWLPAIV